MTLLNQRLLIALGSSAILAPAVLRGVQVSAEATIEAHELAWANPGNAAGILLSYAAAAGTVSAIAAAARRIKTITLNGAMTVAGSAVFVIAAYSAVNDALTFYLSPELGLLSGVAAGAVAMVMVSKWLFPEYSFDAHVRGPRLNSSETIRAERGAGGDGLLPWGADWIVKTRETVHFLLLGNIGGGKTQFLKMMMAAVARRQNELWIVFDSKPEFIPYLTALGREVITLNPLDSRRVGWQISADVYDEMTAQTLVEILVPLQKGSEEFWTKAAQGIVVAVILFLIASGRPWGLREIINICQDPKLLQAVVSSDPKNAIIAEGLTGKNDKSGTNDHMLTVNTYLKKFRPLAALTHRADTTISLKALIHSEHYGNKALVLGTDEEARATLKTFNALMFEVMTNFILALPENRDRRIWVWIDELGEASRFVGKNLARFMTKARSKGGVVVATTQNYSGLVATLETDFARQVVELPNHIAIVGGVNGHTAKEVADTFFGQQERVATTHGQQKEHEEEKAFKEGINKGEEKSSPSYSLESRSLVSKEMLHCTAFPPTGPDHGLTGFFYGSSGGPHFHTYPWQAVKDRQVEAAQVPAYTRVEQGYPEMEVAPFTEAEFDQWFEVIAVEESIDKRYGDNDA